MNINYHYNNSSLSEKPNVDAMDAERLVRNARAFLSDVTPIGDIGKAVIWWYDVCDELTIVYNGKWRYYINGERVYYKNFKKLLEELWKSK